MDRVEIEGTIVFEDAMRLVKQRRPRRVRRRVPPLLTLEKLTDGLAVISLHQPSGRRARPAAAIGAELSVVNGTQPAVEGEAEHGPKQLISRCLTPLPLELGAPSLRLYARWRTQRGKTSPWSLALAIRPKN